jgi:hypothetical protein
VPSKLIRIKHTPFPVCNLEIPPNAEVVCREHVCSAKVENEEHLDGPLSDSFNCNEPIQNLSIGHLIAFIE